jgi:mannose-6-phosphate isomerase-like protein (cupin superfamily)
MAGTGAPRKVQSVLVVDTGRTIAAHATMGPMQKVDVAEKLASFGDHFRPKIVGELNGQHVKLVKFAGEFVWHHHEHEDEMFFVLRGRFRMQFRDRELELTEGQFIIVPRGVEHRPVADEEVSVMLFEPAGTLNTGNVRDDTKTVERLDRI